MDSQGMRVSTVSLKSKSMYFSAGEIGGLTVRGTAFLSMPVSSL